MREPSSTRTHVRVGSANLWTAPTDRGWAPLRCPSPGGSIGG